MTAALEINPFLVPELISNFILLPQSDEKIRQINNFKVMFDISRKILSRIGPTLWKNEKFALTKTVFRQINSLVICLVNAMLSRNFCQNSVRVNSRNFHTVTLCFT